jgi:hypothetical protein
VQDDDLKRELSRPSGELDYRGDIQVLDYRGLWKRNDPAYQIQGDWHPTPLAHKTIAEKLVTDLLVGLRKAAWWMG